MSEFISQESYPNPLIPEEESSSEKLTLGYLALLAFIFSTVFNPARIFSPLAVLHLQDVFAIVALLGFLASIFSSSKKVSLSRFELIYILFVVATALGFINLIQYGAWDRGADLFQNSLKTLVIFIMLCVYPSSLVLIRKGFFIFLLAVALFQIHGVKAIFAGVGLYAGRFVSHVGLVNNSDGIGAFLVMTLPIQLELYLYFSGKLKKYTMLGLGLMSIMLIVLTQTRSAFLSLIIVMPLWVLRRQQRSGRFFVASLLVGALVVVGVYMSTSTDYDNYFARMKSIFASDKYEEDSNVKSRFLFWNQGIEIWKKFPVIGCGIGGMDSHETLTHSDEGIGFTEGLSLSSYSLHQSFIQVLAERGTIGFILFALFLLSLFLSTISSIKILSDLEDGGYCLAISKGLQLSLVAYTINAQFMTITENWMLIIPAGFIAAIHKVAQANAPKEESVL